MDLAPNLIALLHICEAETHYGDYVYLSWLTMYSRRLGGAVTRDEVRERTLELLTTAVLSGYVEVGDLGHSGFIAWTCTAQASLHRVAQEWRALDRDLEMGELCWLRITPTGLAVAQSIPRDQSPA